MLNIKHDKSNLTDEEKTAFNAILTNRFSRTKSHINTSSKRNGYVVRVCSMNLNGKFSKKESYEKFLISDVSPDIIAVGFQELYFKLKDIIAPDQIFNSKIAIQPLRKWIDYFESLKSIKDNYNLLLSKSFAGLCLFIFIRKRGNYHRDAVKNEVTNLLVGTVPVGTFGMANKGAISVSFRFEDMSVCFINCHLPAGAENPGKRQNSMQAVMQRLQFHADNNQNSKRTNFLEAEYDVVYLFGDLNFRLQNISSTDVIDIIQTHAQKAVNKLLTLDELLIMKEDDALYRCFKEANIEFFPTYKFKHGTSNYTDKRVPSYCDRILWMGSVCLNISYESHPNITFSDHIPISADFLVDLGLYQQENIKPLQSSKLHYSPSVSVDRNVIDFGDVFFLHNNDEIITVKNNSDVKAEICIKPINNKQNIPSWLAIIPSKLTLKPQSSNYITFRVFIDCNNVSKFNRNIEKINIKTVCISIVHGVDIPILFQGKYIVNLIGLPLNILKFINKPVPRYRPSDIIELETLSTRPFSFFAHEDLLEKILNVLFPEIKKQSFAMLIQDQASVMEDVLQIIYDINELPVIAQVPLQESKYNIATQIEAFLIFIRSLPQPLIPFVFQARLTQNLNDIKVIKKILGSLHKPNLLILKRMAMFFRNLVLTADDLYLVSHFIVKCIPPSSASLKEPLVNVISTIIHKTDIL